MTLPKSHAGLQQWLATNTYCHKDFPIPELASEVKRKGLIVTVIIPAREVAEYIGGVLEKTVEPLVAAHIITKVIAIDNYSVDGTGAVAAKHGATVLQRTDIAPELGKSLGKGDAMWRALLQTSMAEGSCDNEIIAFLDGDTGNPDPSHLIGIVGPLIYHDHLQMVKGSFDRPFKSKHGDTQPHQGGRVTEILARPLLNGHFPALSGFRQPLAGEFAARRGLLEQLDFPVGYGVEIGTLIDAFRLVGLQALAESDLGIRQNDHKDLRSLGSMALTILNAVERRLSHPGAAGKSLSHEMWLPWENDYVIVSGVERPSVKQYLCQRAKHIDVPNMLNFRDIGGYPASHGSSIRPNLIFRSASFKGLNSVGIQKLLSLGIRAIFDLRSSQEVKESVASGNESGYEALIAMPGGPERFHVPVFADSDHSPEEIAKRFKRYMSKSTEGFEKAYRAILLNSQIALSAILSHLANCSPIPLPMIIHCTAGKDRTGVLVMIIMMLAGCSKTDIAEDYHLTEVGLGFEWKVETVTRLLKSPGFQGESTEAVERMVGARTEVMEAMVTMVETEFGGVEDFLMEKMGINDKTVEACKRALQLAAHEHA